ncbi:MAG: LacI family DNA-binding transcriptional regulator [Armatimonadota bacterium]
MKPTLNDVARSAGLSIATVSRALHRHDSRNVSPETRKRVQTIARDLGYRPNLLGRSLVTGRTQTVSYWTPDSFAPYYALVARGICHEAVRRRYYVHTVDRENHLNARETLTGRPTALELNLDGVIACDIAYDVNPHVAQLRQRGVPMISIGINYPEDGDYVGIDIDQGTALVIQHLLETGRKRIAHMTYTNAEEGRDPRVLVYKRLMNAAGLRPEVILVPSFSRAGARKGIATYVREHGLPEAIFCVNDEVAVGCYRGLADIGVNVPSDTLLAGFDGIEETEYQCCPITTVAAPVKEMCRLAWDFLENRIRDPGRAWQQVTLPPTLICRESSGTAPQETAPDSPTH